MTLPGDRQIVIQVLLFENGCFVSVSEGSSQKMGATALSLSTASSSIPLTSTVIPAADSENTLLLRLMAQKASATIQGVSIVTINLKQTKRISREETAAIVAEIDKMIRNV